MWQKSGGGRTTHLQSRCRSSSVPLSNDLSHRLQMLTGTLEATSLNLCDADDMLGQYRAHTTDQAEAMAQLRVSLEESIQQLRYQRASQRGQKFHPSSLSSYEFDKPARAQPQCRSTSPLRECHSVTQPKRLQAVHFSNGYTPHTQIQSVYHSLQDLSSDQLRLANDFEQEIERRTRIELDTQQSLRELSDMVRMSGVTDEMPSADLEKYEQQQLEMLQQLKKIDGCYEEHGHKQQQTEPQRAVQPKRPIQVRHKAEEQIVKQGQRPMDAEGEVMQLSEVPSADVVMYERQQLQMLQPLKKKEGLCEEHGHKQQQTELRQAAQPSRLIQVNHEAEEQMVKQGQRLIDVEHEVIRLSAYLSKAEEQLANTEKKCEELKMKARAALRQWKTRCLAAEELSGQNARDAEAARSQLSAAAQQAETLRQELARAATWRKTQNEEGQRLEFALQMTFKRAEELDIEMLDLRKSTRKQDLILGHCESKIVCLEAERQKLQDEVTRLELEHRCKNDELAKIIDITKRRAEEAEGKVTFARKETCRLKEEVTKLMIQLEKEHQFQEQKETDGQYSTGKMIRQQEEKAQNLINRTLSEKPSLEDTVQALKVKVMACNADCFAKLMQSENELRERVVMLEAEMKSVIMTFEQEVQALCQVICKDSTDLHVVAESKRQVEPCRWLAETKARLQWLCGESRERQHREDQLRCQLQHCRKQLHDITYRLEAERQQTIE